MAALTMPALIVNYQKKQTVTQLQKAFSILNQAFALSQTETNWPSLATGANANNNQWFETYFFPYLKTLKVCIPSSSDCWAAERKSLNGGGLVNMTRDMASAVLTDGTAMILRALNMGDGRNYAIIFVDLNGEKGPNKLGKDVFRMDAEIDLGKITFFRSEQAANTGRTYFFSDDRACGEGGNGDLCGALIQYDGWEIKDDYPW